MRHLAMEMTLEQSKKVYRNENGKEETNAIKPSKQGPLDGLPRVPRLHARYTNYIDLALTLIVQSSNFVNCRYNLIP